MSMNGATPRMKRLRLLVEMDYQIHPGGRRLKLHGPDLDDLPPELFAMFDLEVLDLSPERQSCIYYRLTEVPAAISRLVNLKVLMLDTNGLTELPEELCLLSHLEKLSLSNNHLGDLPQNFHKLQSLKSLHAANNSFVVLPESLCELSNMYFLDFSDNKLVSLPKNIGKLKKLETLILFKNSLTQLPDAICELRELRMLWLGENSLTRLPRTFGELKMLDWGAPYTISSALDGNPLGHPPLYVCKEGPSAIANYFKLTEPRKANRSKKADVPTPLSDLPEEINGK